MTSLLFVPVVAATLLHIGLLQTKDVAVDVNTIPRHWLIGLSRVLPESPYRSSFTRIQSLILARRNLVHLSTLCSFVLFCHLAASRWSRWRSGCKSQHDSIPSQALRPKAEGRRNFLYAQFSIGMVALSLALRNMSEVLDMGLWQGEIHPPAQCLSAYVCSLFRLDLPRHRSHFFRLSVHHLCDGSACPPWLHSR